jgi:signal peptidase I
MIRRGVGLAVLVILVGWFVALRPASLGGPASWIVVAGDSMEPAIRPGSLVVVTRAPGYAFGDVVAYHVPDGFPGAGDLVIHRIVGGSADVGYVMRGDNTNGPDIWRPRPAEIAGSLWFMFPDVGAAILFLRSPIVIASFAAALTTYAVLGVLSAPRPVGPSRPARPARLPRPTRLPRPSRRLARLR